MHIVAALVVEQVLRFMQKLLVAEMPVHILLQKVLPEAQLS
jgi:hypothetical protein